MINKYVCPHCKKRHLANGLRLVDNDQYCLKCWQTLTFNPPRKPTLEYFEREEIINFLIEVAREPYADSNIESLLKTHRARARSLLNKIFLNRVKVNNEKL